MTTRAIYDPGDADVRKDKASLMEIEVIYLTGQCARLIVELLLDDINTSAHWPSMMRENFHVPKLEIDSNQGS